MAALGVLAFTAHPEVAAQTWETILDYQPVPGQAASGRDIVAIPSGEVFASGSATDASGVLHGTVLKANPADPNWFFSDDTKPAGSYSSVVRKSTFDSLGRLYSIGQIQALPSTSGISYWLTRLSSDSGLTWSTVDTYQYASGQPINATGATADDQGNIYAVGWARASSPKKNTAGNLHWLVRKSGDGGQSWSLADDFEGPATGFGASGAGFVPGAGIFVVGSEFVGEAWRVRRSLTGNAGSWTTVDGPLAGGAAQGVGSDGVGNIYVAGSLFIITQPATRNTPAVGYNAWGVRKSSDGGTTWVTVDLLGARTFAKAVGNDAAGNAIVVGLATDAQNKNHWIVRRLDPLAGWQTIDDFQLAPGYSAVASGVTVDSEGNLLVAGYGSDATGQRWIVRKLAP